MQEIEEVGGCKMTKTRMILFVVFLWETENFWLKK